MTLVVIGPIAKDKIIKSSKTRFNLGGPIYYQSYIYDIFNFSYVSITTLNKADFLLINEFPNSKKVIPIFKNKSYYFVNDYYNDNNLDLRRQHSNFPNIPISKENIELSLKNINNISGFVLNPLSPNDFPLKTIKYIRTIADLNNVPIFLSLQGLLRFPSNENQDLVKLKYNPDLHKILNLVNFVFLDENEGDILFENINIPDIDVNEIIITNGSKGSRIYLKNLNMWYKIPHFKVSHIVDSTGCGDTYMAAYIIKRILNSGPISSGTFASRIASKKLLNNGPYEKYFL